MLYLFRHGRLRMKRNREQNMKNHERTTTALNRLIEQAVADSGESEAYLCTLRLPKQFNDNHNLSNEIYMKTQSDFCKTVFRKTGSTPHYVGVKTDNSSNPEYAFCLFTKPNAKLEIPEDYAEKGRAIANTKSMNAGWGKGKLDLLAVFADAPMFKVSSQPIHITNKNKDEVMIRLQEHLNSGTDKRQQNQRTMFVSRCPVNKK